MLTGIGADPAQIFYELGAGIAEGFGHQCRRGTKPGDFAVDTAAPRIWDLPWSEE
jgi:hypothetical protein